MPTFLAEVSGRISWRALLEDEFESNRSSVPEPDGDDPREVFAFFGLASYHAQVLEQELMLFASMLQLSGRTQITRDYVDELFRHLESRTFGHLLKEARRLTPIPADLDRLLAEALRLRNDLAHTFFARHSEAFISRSGREEMIQSLRAASDACIEADAQVTALRRPLSEKLGLTEALVRQELDRMTARAAVRDRIRDESG